LLVAILLSRIGRIGPLVWYMPISANFMLREVGISLFLACVGLKSGDRFVATLVQGDGLKWMALAALVTVVPLLVVGLVARVFFKLNYLSLCGLLAGSMTDPPALAFVTQATGSEGPSIAYATVYPLTMFLRVIVAQFLVLYLL
jgi:putative transport protein